VLASTLSAGLIFSVAACGGSKDSGSNASTGASASSIDCSPYTKFGDL
jgi:alpha-glucoside transport system substrate-binding protein